jgi:hypothetical protein
MKIYTSKEVKFHTFLISALQGVLISFTFCPFFDLPSFDRRPSVALDVMKKNIPNCPVKESTF